MEVINEKLPDETFFKIRKSVLDSWITGSMVPSIQKSSEFIKGISKNKNFVTKLKEAKSNKVVLTQPRAGVGNLDEFIKILNRLNKEGQADLLTATIDSYTRNNQYEKAGKAIKKGNAINRSLLNGFPAVNYGVEGCKQIMESVQAPIQVRHGTPDARLLSEIIHASGWTSNEGGGICYNIPYAKDVPLEQSITNWQYCDRLVGLYQELGVEINREFFAPLTATMIPPSISNSIMIIETLLAVEQGVKNITLGYSQGGNLIQDIAAVKVLVEQANEYLRKFGYKDIELTTAFHQWMGAFPIDESQAYSVICSGATAAALTNSTKVLVKTPQEALGVPTAEANIKGLKSTKQTLNMLLGQSLESSKQEKTEKELIKEETKLIIDTVLDIGHGDIAKGVVIAFNKGIIDIPFSPSVYNHNNVMPIRDNFGCIRIMEFGSLPFTKDIVEYHQFKLHERSLYENRKVGYDMVINDIKAISEGSLIGRGKSSN